MHNKINLWILSPTYDLKLLENFQYRMVWTFVHDTVTMPENVWYNITTI
jgi:hypothetical protein